MFARWLRSGIRTQITIIVLIGTVLTTGVTLVIANTSITQYGDQQSRTQADRNLKIAYLVLQTAYGYSTSIDATGNLVVDSPTISRVNYTTDPSYKNYGKLQLNNTTTYVDQVHTVLGDSQVSVYQCRDQSGQDLLSCPRISTTLLAADGQSRAVNSPTNPHVLTRNIVNDIKSKELQGITPAYPQTINGVQYMVGYRLLYDPQQNASDPSQTPIGVLEVAEPLTQITTLINLTSLKLLISGVVIMIGGIVLALLVASAIAATLQRASDQLSLASSQLMTISDQQAGGSSQQVWAINAINKALHNLQETSTDITRRTDQLSQIGMQVATRRMEIQPGQMVSVVDYMTRQVNDISAASHQHAQTVDRMSSAMQAVVEVADQVAGSSRQMADSAQRLDQVVEQLEEVVTGRERQARGATAAGAKERMERASGPMAPNMPSSLPRGARPAALPEGSRGMMGPEPIGNGHGNGQRPMLPNGPRQSRPTPRGQGEWDA